MRTRFLNIDYFSPIQALEPQAFLHLPVPHLPPPPSLSSFNDLFTSFASPLHVSSALHDLPLDSALSDFLSAVLPHRIDHADIEHSDAAAPTPRFRETRLSQQEAEVLYEEKEVESQGTCGTETLEIGLPNKDNRDASRYEVIQFETPEPNVFLEDACSFEKYEIQNLSEVPDNENNQEMLRQALTMQCPYEVQELIYSVENVASEYYMEQNIYVLEDDGSVQDQMCFGRSIFPSLEVDETSLGTLTCSSIKEELLLHLENTERQCWLHKDDLVIDSEELLGSRGCDISQFLSDNFLSQQCLESELASVDMFPEMDFISMVETLQIEGNSSVSPVIFEEFQFLDMDSSQFFVVFFKTQTTDEPETCDCMFRGDMNFKNFNELIVSHELALVDNIFKSLPVPLFSDHEKIRSLSSIVEEILADLKPQPLSASDGIYLDWHLLDEDKCNSRIYSSYQSMLEEVDSHSFDFDLEAFDNGKLVFDFVFSDNALNGPNTEENKESRKFLSDVISVPNGDIVGGTSNKLLDDQYPEPGNGEHLAEKSAERTLLFKSMSQFNDLDFFLNPRKANSGNVDSTINTVDTNAMIPDVPSSHSKAACLSTGVQLQSWEIVLYQVKLSNTIMLIIDNFEKSYLAVLQNERELIKTDLPLLAADNHKLLSLPKQKLMDCIKKINAQRTTSHGDENIMELVTLCAIKQMAWFMCFYGILPVHLYVDKLCQSLECLKSRLGILQSLIEDAHKKTDREICSLHPSLTVIQEILRSNTTKSNLKVLIVAEKIFWWSLKSLLMSLGLSFSEFQNYYPHAKEPDLCKTDFEFTRTDTSLVPDCLLASHEHISASFPFNKFNIILEYGGSYGISRISSFSPNLVGLPPIHFLKVELDKSSTCEALCEGVDMPCYSETTMQEDGNIKKLEKLLNFLPIENTFDMGSSGAADEAEACCMPLPLPTMPFAMKSENISQSMVSSPETIIIVNTQNFDKQMIVSRRSTYQKILAMEKEGAQVVERDSDLPVDVIMSSAICLAWYDCRNIGKKATALDEASSSMPMCVENIATNVLTLLSFAFSGCILVFEGDVNFLSTVMESSDGFYAAAASLGIDLQIFCSYSSELTDDIILSCISYVIKLTRGLFPKMPESETLAESFLTKFPSINPLTAHAILSSGGILVEFLEGSHERRIHAIENYLVSDESVTLFSALCKYGERDDSKSIMTDCSSSVSSGPDSERCRFNVDSGRKRRKYSGSPHKIDIDMDDLLCFEPLNQITADNLDPSTVSKSLNQWMSKDYELFDEFRTPSLTSNGLFGQKQGLDMGMMIKPSSVTKPCDSQFSKSPPISNEIKKPYFSLSDKKFGQNQGSDLAMMNNLDWLSAKKPENLQDLIGEVIDLTDSPVSGKDLSSFDNSPNFSFWVPEMDGDSSRKSKIARRLSFDEGGHPTCLMAVEMNSNSDIWNFKKDQRQTVPGVNDYPDTDFNDIFPVKHRGMPNEGLTQRSAGNSKELSFQEKEMSSYGGTPLSNALRSAHPQQNSPWTIEFLNRIREKSRMRHQSLPYDAVAPSLEYSGNVSKVSKRRSPSILEFFKYQGGSTPKKAPEQKRQKRSIMPSSSSKNEKISSSVLPTSTPADKRARQTLSFAMNGSGGQTKLVWSDGARSLNKRFQNQI
ncbi:protein SHORTAGE IN CHIASMATA 1 [Quercus lobata]|nr:protein SHORTAGE IN CHIASMATA 1 [Quercus lobata]